MRQIRLVPDAGRLIAEVKVDFVWQAVLDAHGAEIDWMPEMEAGMTGTMLFNKLMKVAAL